MPGLKPMEQQKEKPSAAANPPIPSCRKKKNEEATFLEDLKDHIDEFINASMDEHKSCFKKTINKVYFHFLLWDLKEVIMFLIYVVDVFVYKFQNLFGWLQMFRMSKVVADRNSETSGVESSLPLRTTVSE